MFNFSFSLIFCEKMLFCVLIKAQVTCISHFYELCQGKCWKLNQIFNLLTIRTSIDIFGTEKCQVILALSIF